MTFFILYLKIVLLQVVGNPGSDGSGRTSIFHGRISSGDFVLEYSVFQIFEAGDASICELYFSVYNSVVSFLIFYICSRYLLCVKTLSFFLIFLSNYLSIPKWNIFRIQTAKKKTKSV